MVTERLLCTARDIAPSLRLVKSLFPGARFDLTMAASVLVILPIVIIYFFFQRWIVRGIALTGFK